MHPPASVLWQREWSEWRMEMKPWSKQFFRLSWFHCSNRQRPRSMQEVNKDTNPIWFHLCHLAEMRKENYVNVLQKCQQSFKNAFGFVYLYASGFIFFFLSLFYFFETQEHKKLIGFFYTSTISKKNSETQNF